MFERYTQKARRVIFFGRYEASNFGAQYFETEHLLLGLLREDPELVQKLLPKDAAESIRKQVAEHKPTQGRVSTSVDMPLSQECKRVLAFAAEEAERLAHRHVGTEHLFLGLLREEKCFAAQLLGQFGLEGNAVRVQIASWAPTEPPPPWSLLQDLAPPLGHRRRWPQGMLRRWYDGSLRKSQSLDRVFHWEKRLSAPRAALMMRGGGRVMLYSGQSYDPAVFHVVYDGWKHDHCAVCWQSIYIDDYPGQSFGYTNGQEWLCEACYGMLIAPGA
ncbi:MAG: Clp protease N-terminal domain-containing protein [Terriglobia bacterium]